MSRTALERGFVLACAAALAGRARAAPVAQPAPRRVLRDGAAASLVDAGARCRRRPTGPRPRRSRKCRAPAVRYLPNVARATNLPWIDSNGWRFARGIRKARYATLPAGSAPLAAAEAFVFDVDAILNPDPKDVDELGNMLRFLKALEQPPLPEMVNIGVVDDPSPLMGEVLNLLTRRNLLVQGGQGTRSRARPHRSARHAGLPRRSRCQPARVRRSRPREAR